MFPNFSSIEAYINTFELHSKCSVFSVVVMEVLRSILEEKSWELLEKFWGSTGGGGERGWGITPEEESWEDSEGSGDLGRNLMWVRF